MFSPQDNLFMQRALELAAYAASLQEVPVGAVLVHENKIVGEGYNSSITLHDPSAHAEIMAIRSAAKQIKNYRLLDTTLYVTLEPCMMCVGAIVHARIKQVIYGACDAKSGAIISKIQALDHSFLNHRVQHRGGLLAEPCGHILSEFFQKRRD